MTTFVAAVLIARSTSGEHTKRLVGDARAEYYVQQARGLSRYGHTILQTCLFTILQSSLAVMSIYCPCKSNIACTKLAALDITTQTRLEENEAHVTRPVPPPPHVLEQIKLHTVYKMY
jgi:hypothetical protein